MVDMVLVLVCTDCRPIVPGHGPGVILWSRCTVPGLGVHDRSLGVRRQYGTWSFKIWSCMDHIRTDREAHGPAWCDSLLTIICLLRL